MLKTGEKRWKEAQEAEKNHFRQSRVEVEYFYVIKYFNKYFKVDNNFFKRKTILEVGCSPMAAIHGIEGSGLRVGIDPLALDWIKKYPGNVEHFQARGEYLPFQSSSFDMVLCLNVLDHVQNPILVLEEIRRVLKDDGQLLLWLNTYSVLGVVRNKLGLIDHPHPHHFNDCEITKILENAGMCIKSYSSNKENIGKLCSLIWKHRHVSSAKYVGASLFLGLQESSWLCLKKH